MGSEALATAQFDLAFRFARDASADAWFREQTGRLLERLVAIFGAPRIRAIIVSGSLARGEGGLARLRDEPFPVADLDLYVVARTTEDAVVLRDARHDFLEPNEQDPLRADVGVATAADLANMPDTIANYSLGRDAKVVWGDAAALSLVRRTDPNRIPREDAINLVLNRAAEELAALRAAEQHPESRAHAFGVHYRGIKTVADVGLAILLCRGACEPAYAGRGERVAGAIAADPLLAEMMPAGFAREVEAACDWKLAPRADAVEAHLPGAANTPASVAGALETRVSAVRGFCRWYARGAADPLRVLATSEPLPRAARTWARYARRSPDGRRALLRRLGGARLRPTPRLSVQLAALALYLAWNESAAESPRRRAARLLPQGDGATGREALVDATIAAWEREIMNRKRG